MIPLTIQHPSSTEVGHVTNFLNFYTLCTWCNTTENQERKNPVGISDKSINDL